MEANDIAEKLEAYTAAHSNFETRRDYISLSHCSQSAHELAKQFVGGFDPSQCQQALDL